MQLRPSVLNLLIRLQLKVGLGRQLGQVGILLAQLRIQIVELVESLLKFPLAASQSHMHDVEDNLISSLVNSALEARQLDLYCSRDSLDYSFRLDFMLQLTLSSTMR